MGSVASDDAEAARAAGFAQAASQTRANVAEFIAVWASIGAARWFARLRSHGKPTRAAVVARNVPITAAIRDKVGRVAAAPSLFLIG